jgi:chemotaxis protein CheX
METNLQSPLVTEEQLTEVMESVFSAMLCLPIAAPKDQSVMYGSSQLAGYVHISGTWNGTVLLMCSEHFGRKAAAIMLGVSERNVTLSDVHDAIAELANIIAGGIKCVLPAPSSLSLPTVTYGSHYSVHVPRTVLVGRIELASDHEPIQLRLLQAAPGV